MINPFFLIPPSNLNVDPKNPDLQYLATGLYQLQEYTLVEWRLGNFSGGEYATGNTLYKGQQVLFCAGGYLRLSDEVEDNIKSTTSKSNMPANPTFVQRIDSSIGAYGVPQMVGRHLRDPQNYTPLIPPGT